ncbi:MAG: adenosylmethionine--8-amino-7-oxononanoate transaminase [Planctomycetota bacterium]|nr:adenosylmethionine--8-amino-7-oxononanoate transaminase [Planctomycetota bacterium]
MTNPPSPIRQLHGGPIPAWQQAGANYVWSPYTPMKTAPLPIPVVATEGVCLVLDDGTRLIDGMASWWTACHGYNHPHILTKVTQQLQRMPHVMFGGVHHEPALRLASRLAQLLPGDLDHVFFSDSGSVSVEVALKMAVQYWLNRGVSGRSKFLSFRHAYHGDTTGAMSVCDPVSSMHSHFKGFLLEQFTLGVPHTDEDFSELDRFLRDRRDSLAGVIIEPLVQGAGGMKFHGPESFARLRQLCDQHEMLLIADEIATGFGRTGTMFACEQAAVVPDIICVGKALTAGTMSLAATIATDRVFEEFWSADPAKALMHGPTFMANPLACAAANASLDLFETEPRIARVAEIEEGLAQGLEPCRELVGVVDVRTKGAIGVVQVAELHHLEQLRAALVAEGVWLRPFSDIVYMTPPLTISDDELDKLCSAVRLVMAQWVTW